MILQAGSIIDHRFEVREQGRVNGLYASYRAYDREAEVEVSLWMVRDGLFEDDAATELFVAGLNGVRQLRHPNLRRIFSVGRCQHGVCISTQSSDTDVSQVSTPVSHTELLKVAYGICEALEVAHQNGYVHGVLSYRDVVTISDLVKVGGVGIFQHIDATKRDVVVGEHGGRLAPELLRGGVPVVKTDVFAYAYTVAELASECFDSTRPEELLEAVSSKAPELQEVLMPALSPSLLARTPSVKELFEQIAGVYRQDGDVDFAFATIDTPTTAWSPDSVLASNAVIQSDDDTPRSTRRIRLSSEASQVADICNRPVLSEDTSVGTEPRAILPSCTPDGGAATSPLGQCQSVVDDSSRHLRRPGMSEVTVRESVGVQSPVLTERELSPPILLDAKPSTIEMLGDGGSVLVPGCHAQNASPSDTTQHDMRVPLGVKASLCGPAAALGTSQAEAPTSPIPRPLPPSTSRAKPGPPRARAAITATPIERPQTGPRPRVSPMLAREPSGVLVLDDADLQPVSEASEMAALSGIANPAGPGGARAPIVGQTPPGAMPPRGLAPQSVGERVARGTLQSPLVGSQPGPAGHQAITLPGRPGAQRGASTGAVPLLPTSRRQPSPGELYPVLEPPRQRRGTKLMITTVLIGGTLALAALIVVIVMKRSVPANTGIASLETNAQITRAPKIATSAPSAKVVRATTSNTPESTDAEPVPEAATLAQDSKEPPQLAGPATSAAGPCPAQMLQMGDALCIDKYEATTTDGLPVTDLTWADAEFACAARGARLCTLNEWVEACRGPKRVSFPYGSGYRRGRCNVRSGGRREVVAPGSFAQCVSASGAFDMSGNAAEWLADGQVAGGSARNKHNGRCSRVQTVDTERRYSDVGYRCCSPPRAAIATD